MRVKAEENTKPIPNEPLPLGLPGASDHSYAFLGDHQLFEAHLQKLMLTRVPFSAEERV